MTLLNDLQIQKLAENDILFPFVGEKQRSLGDGTSAISFGLSQAGYDIRLSAGEFLVFNETILDAKSMSNGQKATLHGDATSASQWYILPPHCHGLGTSLELISMPNDIFAFGQGKSTYARCGLISNITPLEPGWSGHLTMCFVNPTPFPIKLYANEGIAQLVFFAIEEVGRAYEGAYQHQGAKVKLAAV